MKKNLTALIMATLFFAGTVVTGMAASYICEVTSVEGTSVVLDCGDKAKKIAVGDKVKVRVKKAQTDAIEGC